MKIVYISDGTWFDRGTEVELVDDYREDIGHWNAGCFRGLKDGKIDEEVCRFQEFEVREVEETPS